MLAAIPVHLLLATSLTSYATAATARGVVFHDLDGDGVHDPDEPGIPEVAVSNGRDVVRTDASGRYRLRVDNDTILFVVKPRGWATPVDDHQLPQFYYIHKPKGSPQLRHAGVAPTGRLPRSVDFPLLKQEEPDTFEVILFGDPQPRTQQEIDYLTHDIIEPLIGSEAAFGVTLGDILYDDLSLFGSINQAISLIGIPWYNVIGNHDINFDAESDAHSDETFERYYGPSYYAFDYGPVHFLVLDDVHWSGRVGDADAYRGGNYTGGLGPDQLEFIRRDLELIPENQLVVLFMHIPLIAEWKEPDRAALYRLLEDRPLAMSISAHFHMQEHLWLTKEDGWQGPEPHHHVIAVTTSGSWWRGLPDQRGIPVTTMRDGAPNGHLTATFSGSEYVLDYHAAAGAPAQQLHIWTPESIWRRRLGLTEFVVNVYNGSERTKVEYRVGEGTEWALMTRTARPDPYYEEAKQQETDDMPDSWKLPDPVPSPHVWAAKFPPGLAKGLHSLEVRVTDPWGRQFLGRRGFRVQ